VTTLDTHTAGQVTSTDAAFFTALLDQDVSTLDALLGDDFLIVQVDTGTVHRRAEFLAAVQNGLVVFKTIDVDTSDTVIRLYGDVAIVVGRTRMTMTAPDGSTVEAASRYSHVFAAAGDEWRLVSAQGTAISE
jgi:ketosteroid isomerase-like protein